MLFNEVKIKLSTGNGGFANQCFYIKNNKKIYNGGKGGNAGNIFLICDKNILNFKNYFFYKNIKTNNGFSGKCFNKIGKNSKDIIFRVPLGSNIINLDNNKLLYKFINHKKIFLLIKGGMGGKISYSHKKKIKIFLPTKGDNLLIKLNFNYNFYVVILGFPNSGKSTFINTIFNKFTKVSNYSFSTLLPNIFSFKNYFFLDTPGIIGNSLQGKGLGLNFLNFTKNSKIFLNFIDVSLINYDFILFYYNIKTLNNELYKYSKITFYKSRWLIFNKIDLLKINLIKIFLKKFLLFYKWYKNFFLLSSLNKLSCKSLLKTFFKKEI